MGCDPAILWGPGEGGAARPKLGVSGPRGAARAGPGGQAPVSAGELDLSPARCATAGVPEAQRRYRAKTGLALEMVAKPGHGGASARVGCGGRRFGMSPGFRDGLTAEGMQYVLDVRPDTPVWPLEPTWSRLAYHGRGRPPQLKPRHQERLSVAERSLAQPKEAWREVTWRRERRGRGHTGSALSGYGKRGTGSRVGCSGRFTARTWTAASPATTSPTHPRTPPWRPWPAWEGHGGLLRPSSRPQKSDVGLDEYETRMGWVASPITLYACWPGPFC